MRVVVPYTALHPFTLRALKAYAPEAEVIDLGNQGDAYYELLCELWSEGEGFLIVEQDIEIHASVVPQLEECLEDWCIFGYPGPLGAGIWPPPDQRLLTRSLGCTRFSASLIKAEPDLMENLPLHYWGHLDFTIDRALSPRWAPHVHQPHVNHHHLRQGRCDCGEAH